MIQRWQVKNVKAEYTKCLMVVLIVLLYCNISFAVSENEIRVLLSNAEKYRDETNKILDDIKNKSMLYLQLLSKAQQFLSSAIEESKSANQALNYQNYDYAFQEANEALYDSYAALYTAQLSRTVFLVSKINKTLSEQPQHYAEVKFFNNSYRNILTKFNLNSFMQEYDNILTRPRNDQIVEKVKYSYDWYYEDIDNFDIKDFYAELLKLDKQIEVWVNNKKEEIKFENVIQNSRLVFWSIIIAIIFGFGGLLVGISCYQPVVSRMKVIINKFTTTLNDSSYLELDDIVRKNLDEAEKCFKAGLYVASAVMLGRTLESALKIYYQIKTHEKTSKTINELLNWAETNQHIPKEQLGEGRLIKLIRNVAAHHETKVDITKNKIAVAHEELLKILEVL